MIPRHQSRKEEVRIERKKRVREEGR